VKFAKTVFALLFSLALVWTQTVFVSDAQAGEEAAPSCCHRCSCCATPSNPAPEPVPVAPVRTLSQNDLQLVAVVTQTLLKQTVSLAPKNSYSFLVSVSLPAIPIYERNCSFLI
jgi:hypothetical protein